jgi:hypothetical protein
MSERKENRGLEILKEDVFNSINVRVESPDGTMFVTVMENEGALPFKVLVNIGKAGTSLAAWANALADFVSESIPRLGVNGVVAMLLNIRSDKVSFTPDTWTRDGIVTVRSGPEAIAYALIKYRTEKHRDFMKGLGISEDDNLEDFFRPANSA